MMKINKVLVLSASVLVSGFLVQGCEKIVHSPTELSQSKLQVQEEAFFDAVSVDDMDAGYIAALSRHYSSKGDGAGVEVSVTYDPQSRTNTAMHATSQAARISEEFRKNGVANIGTSIIPVKGQGDVSQALISYDSYSIESPDDCLMMAGYEDRNIDATYDYKLGCTRDALFAKQIARPKDLIGGGGQLPETSDGRRAGNIVEAYRTGVQNEELEGESASDTE